MSERQNRTNSSAVRTAKGHEAYKAGRSDTTAYAPERATAARNLSQTGDGQRRQEEERDLSLTTVPVIVFMKFVIIPMFRIIMDIAAKWDFIVGEKQRCILK